MSNQISVVHFVCDRTPDQNGCNFIECEDENGNSINAGEWRLRGDGLVELVVSLAATPGYTAVDMTTAAAEGFRDGAASVVVELPPPYPVPEEPDDAIDDSFMDAYHAATGMRNACKQFIIAAGGRVKE